MGNSGNIALFGSWLRNLPELTSAQRESYWTTKCSQAYQQAWLWASETTRSRNQNAPGSCPVSSSVDFILLKNELAGGETIRCQLNTQSPLLIQQNSNFAWQYAHLRHFLASLNAGMIDLKNKKIIKKRMVAS